MPSAENVDETAALAAESQDPDDELTPREDRFPENATYGCVDCGSVNHTTGDVTWCTVAQAAVQHRALEVVALAHAVDPALRELQVVANNPHPGRSDAQGHRPLRT